MHYLTERQVHYGISDTVDLGKIVGHENFLAEKKIVGTACSLISPNP